MGRIYLLGIYFIPIYFNKKESSASFAILHPSYLLYNKMHIC